MVPECEHLQVLVTLQIPIQSTYCKPESQSATCRYYLLKVDPDDAKRPVLKQSVAAEDLLKEAEEQAGLDEVYARHTCSVNMQDHQQSIRFSTDYLCASICRYSCLMPRVSDGT